MTCIWPWNEESLKGVARVSRRTLKSPCMFSTLTGTRSKYDTHVHHFSCPISSVYEYEWAWPSSHVSFSSTGLHQLGHWRAEHLRVSLVRSLPQQQPSLERDGQAAHPYRPFQGVPPSLWVQTLFKWATTVAPSQSNPLNEQNWRYPNMCMRHDIMFFVSAKDKGEKKLFGFAFTPLMREDGTTLSDEVHELYVYKVR